MFVETYYDEATAVRASTGQPSIPYPELVGEELALWQRYLPIKRPIESVYNWFERAAPNPVITEVKLTSYQLSTDTPPSEAITVPLS